MTLQTLHPCSKSAFLTDFAPRLSHPHSRHSLNASLPQAPICNQASAAEEHSGTRRPPNQPVRGGGLGEKLGYRRGTLVGCIGAPDLKNSYDEKKSVAESARKYLAAVGCRAPVPSRAAAIVVDQPPAKSLEITGIIIPQCSCDIEGANSRQMPTAEHKPPPLTDPKRNGTVSTTEEDFCNIWTECSCELINVRSPARR